MTEQEITGLGTAFASYLRRFRDCFVQKRTAAHFDTYCRGLLSDLPRKSIEPVALAAGTAVRTLQEFLVTACWDHERARATLQRHLAETLAGVTADAIGTVGVIDETSCQKWGDHTPGVQRQYLGCVGKVDNGIVTVHLAVAKGRFQALLDADLYLPKAWDDDRQRCRAAGIPDAIRYQPKWRLALEQWLRLHRNGITFDWLTFDEGYGAAVPFLEVLNLAQQRFVAEVPVNFSVRDRADGRPQRADERLTRADATAGRHYRLAHQTVADSVWRVASRLVWVAQRAQRLLVAINEATAEVKYFLTNATHSSVREVLTVAFRRWTVEHGIRLAKQETGLMHYEGRNYIGLSRHLILALIVLGFVAGHTERLRGEKPAGDGGASLPGTERPLHGHPTPPPRHPRVTPHQRRHMLSPETKRAGQKVTQETTA